MRHLNGLSVEDRHLLLRLLLLEYVDGSTDDRRSRLDLLVFVRGIASRFRFSVLFVQPVEPSFVQLTIGGHSVVHFILVPIISGGRV